MRDHYTIERQFKAYRLPCVALANHIVGHRCGYVGVRKGHPLYGLGYSEYRESLIPYIRLLGGSETESWTGEKGVSPDMLLRVHGGLTFSSDGKEEYPVASKGVWWFGFNCGHSGDLVDLSLIDSEGTRDTYAKLMQSIKGKKATVKDTEYVVKQCKDLARQLSYFL